MAKTYYLTEDISQVGKKLGNLKGWRGEIATAILNTKAEDEAVVGQIHHVLSKTAGRSEAALVDEVIPLLPKAIRSKARILAHHLIKHLKIGEHGQVIYPDGTDGSSFIDHLKYFASPPNLRVVAPFDVDKMREIISKTHAPLTSVRPATRSPTAAWISL